MCFYSIAHTKQFNMPLPNICAISGNNNVIQLGVVFLSGERKGDYTWVLRQLRNVIATSSIEEPVSIVTDRELALISCIDTLFLESRHLLCRLHVNINVLAKTKKYSPGSIKDSNGKVKRHPSFQAFLDQWNTLLSSSTEESYDALLKEMNAKHPQLAISYCTKT